MVRSLFVLVALLIVAVPTMASAVLPRPVEVEVIDVPNDDGSAVGVLWRWEGDFPDTATVTIEVELPNEAIAEYALNADELQRVIEARAWLAEKLGPILPDMYASDAELATVQEALTLADANKDSNTPEVRRDYWIAKIENNQLHEKRDDFWLDFTSRVLARGEDLFIKNQDASFLNATATVSPWLVTNINPDGTIPDVKGESENRFGQDPPEADKLYAEIISFSARNPQIIADTYTNEPDDIDHIAPRGVNLDLRRGTMYNFRMVVTDGDESATYDLAGAEPKVNYFNLVVVNNLIFAIGFSIIILVAIMMARRNPNMFIRRISGLEAVDEAIGRATEMGKPVLYLTGLDSLATLSTLAAVNILGRVARRIADYDSDLIVPNRDPIVMSVAQEVVREAYIDQGRPDAYKEENIFFVTDDQFSFTATTCAIMMRDKPAANFFMGYYYAESLLLAETGAATGAIQIAGTDALHQLPFFITTCDYTLIGEELYAASAYLGREPMLLGSLKGQDLGKAMILLLILIQTILFIFSPEWDWLKSLAEAL